MRIIRIGGHSYDRNLPPDETVVEWIGRIRGIGAEPLIQVSQYDTPEEAARIVSLFNKRRAGGAPVRYWSIGNEPWLQGGKGDSARFAPKIEAYFKSISAAMKKVDPTIKVFGPNASFGRSNSQTRRTRSTIAAVMTRWSGVLPNSMPRSTRGCLC